MCSKSPYPFILLLQEKLIRSHTPQLVLGDFILILSLSAMLSDETLRL